MTANAPLPRRSNGTTPDGETYRALLRAAREVMCERGYDKTTVDDIRRGAGVSRATFYFYFQDKRQVLIRLLNDTTHQYHELYRTRYRGGDDYQRIVLTHIEYFAHYSRDSEIMLQCQSIALHDEVFHEMVEEVRRGFRERVVRQISRLISRQIVRPTNVELLSLILVGMVEKFTIEFFRKYRTEELIREHIVEGIQAISESWYHALYLREAPRPYPYEELLRGVEFHGLS
jgi:AcrR family transcriptional regulator